MEGLNWAARFVPEAFLLIIMFFGLALIVSGIFGWLLSKRSVELDITPTKKFADIY